MAQRNNAIFRMHGTGNLGFVDQDDPRTIAFREELLNGLEEYAKKYAFQLERAPTTQMLHFQIKVSWITKVRVTNAWQPTGFHIHWTPELASNSGDWSYVTKEESRVDGPWKSWDDDDTPYIPEDVRNIVLRPWQASIRDAVPTIRHIHVIVDANGNIGKTTITKYLCCRRLAQLIPPIFNYLDMMQIVMSAPINSKYIIDMPRSIPQKKLDEFWSAIESIKGGHAFDLRYKYKERWFEPPSIWVFTNKMPDLTKLTPDRWLIYNIVNDELQQIHPIVQQAEVQMDVEEQASPRSVQEVVTTPLVRSNAITPRNLFPYDESDGESLGSVDTVDTEVLGIQMLTPKSSSSFDDI